MSISISTNVVFKPLTSAPNIFSLKRTNLKFFVVSNALIPYLSRSYSPHPLREITSSPSLASCVAQTSELLTQAEEEPQNCGDAREVIEIGIPTSDVAAENGLDEDPKNVIPAPDGTRLFVGNLPYDFDAPTLAGLFQQAGIVEFVDVMMNNQTQVGRGFGFVTMSTIEESEKAIKMFHRYDLNGRLLTVNKAAPKGTKPEKFPNISHPEFRIHVGNLPWDVDKPRLEELFQNYGKVLYARIVYERETNQSRGFGFVTMSSEHELDNAIAAVDGKVLNGRILKVSKAQERPTV